MRLTRRSLTGGISWDRRYPTRREGIVEGMVPDATVADAREGDRYVGGGIIAGMGRGGAGEGIASESGRSGEAAGSGRSGWKWPEAPETSGSRRKWSESKAQKTRK